MLQLSYVFCTDCGIQNRFKSKFCFKCGNRLQKDVVADKEQETKLINGIIEPNQIPFMHHESNDDDVVTEVVKVTDDDEADTYTKNTDITTDTSSSNQSDQEIKNDLIDQDTKNAETADIDDHFHLRFNATAFVPNTDVSSIPLDHLHENTKPYSVCYDHIIKNQWDHTIKNQTKSNAIYSDVVCCHDVFDFGWNGNVQDNEDNEDNEDDEDNQDNQDIDDKSQNAEDTKQDLCRFYGSAKGCEHGERCIYSHSNPNSVGLCKFFRIKWGGGCQWGDKCKFRHQIYQEKSDDHKADLLHTILNDIIQR